MGSGRSSLASSPSSFAGFGEEAGLDLSGLGPKVERQVAARLMSRDFDAWSEAAARVGHCAAPIRLRGRSHTVEHGHR